jgi:hypothetical protein
LSGLIYPGLILANKTKQNKTKQNKTKSKRDKYRGSVLEERSLQKKTAAQSEFELHSIEECK